MAVSFFPPPTLYGVPSAITQKSIYNLAQKAETGMATLANNIWDLKDWSNCSGLPTNAEPPAGRV